MHDDEDKHFLFEALKNQFGYRIDALVDMFTLILMETSRYVVIPLIDRHIHTVTNNG